MINQDWIECELGEVCEILDNLRKPINSTERNERIKGKAIAELFPYYGATGKVGYIDDYLTNGDYILLGEDAAPFLDFSKDVAYKITGKTWVNNHAHILKSHFNDSFLLHFLNQFQYRDYVTGTTRLKLTQSALKRIPTKLAPLPIQRAIVSKIEALFSDLDNGIANLKQAQAQLKIYRQAVLKKAFEGELTKEWREKQTNLPTAEELLKQIKQERQNHYNQQVEDWKKAVKEWEANGKKYRKPIRPVKLAEIDANAPLDSNNWLMVEMGAIAELIDPQPSHRTPPIEENGIPFISTANFNKETGEIDFIGARKVSNEVLNDQISLFKIIDGDFIVGKIGTVGKPFIIPSKRFFTLSANLVLVQASRNICSSKYLFNLVKSNLIQNQFREGANSTTQAAFGIQKFRLLRIPLPTLSEQTQIVQEIERRLSVCDKMEQSLNESLLKAEALRQSILKKAFEGKLLSPAEIAQCQKEPDYEPASELIKKIKTDKLSIEQGKRKKPA